jgi:hypothetical protein
MKLWDLAFLKGALIKILQLDYLRVAGSSNSSIFASKRSIGILILIAHISTFSNLSIDFINPYSSKSLKLFKWQYPGSFSFQG